MLQRPEPLQLFLVFFQKVRRNPEKFTHRCYKHFVNGCSRLFNVHHNQRQNSPRRGLFIIVLISPSSFFFSVLGIFVLATFDIEYNRKTFI